MEEVFDIPDEVLDDPPKSPWYNVPLKTGGVFVEDADPYDYQDGQGLVFIGSINYPVRVNGKIVGVLGIDLVYKRILEFIQDVSILGEPARVSLLSRNGHLIYSVDPSGTSGRSSPLPGEVDPAVILRGGYPVIHTVFDETMGEEMVVCLSRVVVNESVEPILLRLDLPASVFLRRTLVLLRTFLLISVFGAVLIVICVILASSTIVRPIAVRLSHQV